MQIRKLDRRRPAVFHWRVWRDAVDENLAGEYWAENPIAAVLARVVLTTQLNLSCANTLCSQR